MSAEQNRAALGAAIVAWNQGDGETYLKVYDPAIRHYGLGPEPLDQAANRASYEAMWAAFPGSQITIDDTIADGDQLAARFHLSGKHLGEFMGIPQQGGRSSSTDRRCCASATVGYLSAGRRQTCSAS